METIARHNVTVLIITRIKVVVLRSKLTITINKSAVAINKVIITEILKIRTFEN